MAVFERIERFIITCSENPKTTLSGVGMIAVGVDLLIEKKIAEGVASIIGGSGLLLAMDQKQK